MMDAQSCYIALKTLIKETVPDNMARAHLLDELEQCRVSRPNNPPAKGLMADIEPAMEKSLITVRHANLIKDIAHYWI